MNNRAFRDSFLAAQKMKDFDDESRRRRAGLRWWHDYAFGLGFPLLAIFWVACIGAVLYMLFTAVFG